MLAFLGLLLVIWLAFIVIGAVFHAVFWLAIIGVVLFLITAAFGWMRRRTRPARNPWRSPAGVGILSRRTGEGRRPEGVRSPWWTRAGSRIRAARTSSGTGT